MSITVLRYLRKSAARSLADANASDVMRQPHVADLQRRDWQMLNAAAQFVAKHLGLRHWYVSTQGSGPWMVVETVTKTKARSLGVAEFGRGQVATVRLATPAEVKEYVAVKGEIELEDS